MARTLLVPLETLLSNSGKKKNPITGELIKEPIFSEEELLEFLNIAESATKTCLKAVNDVVIYNSDLVVEYAFALALMSKSLLEKGREYAYDDSGISYNPPSVADHLTHVAQMAFDNWHRKVQLLRA